MNIVSTLTQTFCCILPCPICLVVFAIPASILTLKRRSARRFDAEVVSQEVSVSSQS